MALGAGGAATDSITNAANAQFLIPYVRLYTGPFTHLKPIFFILLTGWILYMFYMLFNLAERHFKWALQHLSHCLRLSPDLAGMTLLAFGNGAPDFFTAVFGASEAPELILGSSVGAGLFILTVVFGIVIVVARDPRSQVGEPGEEDIRFTAPDRGRIFNTLHPAPFIRGSLLYLLCVILLGVFATYRRVPVWMPCILLGIYFLYLAFSIAFHFLIERRNIPHPPNAGPESEPRADSKSEDDKIINNFCSLSPLGKLSFALRKTYFRSGSTNFTTAINLIRATILAPVNIAYNLTILPMEIPENSARNPAELVSLYLLHRIRRLANPPMSLLLFVSLFFEAKLSLFGWLLYALASAALVGVLYVSENPGGTPKYFSIHVAYGFATCILWIYAVSTELVACLAVTGLLAGISTTIMGIVVLAWGNSFGDLVANSTMSRNGLFETAVAAVFSGPIQNVLLTLGVAFLVAAWKSPGRVLAIDTLRGDIYVALALLSAVVTICLVVIPFVYSFRLPRYFGIVLISIYVLYLPFAILIGIGVLKLPVA